MKRFSRVGAATVALATLGTLVFSGTSPGHGLRSSAAKATAHHPGKAGDGRTKKAILFASDGMRPDLVEKYAAIGVMPTMKELMRNGVRGRNGLLQGFPPNTGVGWHTLATGAWPSTHGSTNNTFHRTGAGFDTTSSFATTGILQADTMLQAAERAGKKVLAMEWVAARGLVPALQGPVVDFRTFIGGRGIVLNFDLPGQPALANSFGVQYQRQTLAGATGWTNVPASFSPAKETTFTHNNAAIPGGGVWDVFIYDSTNDSTVNYDHVLVVNSSAGKNGSAAVATLARGQWADGKLTLASGFLAGKTAGFYTKLIDLSPDASRFRLYFTSVQRVNATYNALGTAGSDAFAETLARDFPTSTAADFAPLEALIVDEDTYVQQGLMWADAHWAYLRYIIQTLGYKPDVAFVGSPVTDEFQHQFLALVTRTDIDGRPNPYYDDVNGDGTKDNRLAAREGYIRAAYHEADSTLALTRSLMGRRDTTVMASADHGFAPQWLAINARKILFDKTVRNTVTGADVSLHPSGNPALTATNPLSNCRAQLGAADLAKACWAGGAVQIYVNPTLPAGITYEAVRTAARQAFANLTDPGVAGQRPSSTNAQVISRIMNKEELRNVDGTDALHPNRSGDVVVASRPPYQFDAATAGQDIAFSQFFGQHGYLPDLVNLARNVNMHAAFVAAGPGIQGGASRGFRFSHDDDDDDDDGGHRGLGGRQVSGLRAIDVAPTLSFLLGIPGPQHASGKIRYDMLKNTGDLRELTILDISDYHGQLVPFTPEAADYAVAGTPPVATALGPTFAIGGSAFLKPWFDSFRREARNGSLTVTAGDAVGATPPISAFFGDKPTIEFMNLMGFSADGLGNHNFDVSHEYMRFTLKPLANFPYLSANIVDSAGNTPAEWSPSKIFNFHGAKLGLIGFSNEDIPMLTRPGALGPFHVGNATDAVNAEAARLARKTDAVVAMGHHGATTSVPVRTEPYYAATVAGGPVVDLADNVRNVDAVIGDHTDFQIMSNRSNGVLLVENRSKGIRFTRLRLVVDKSSGRVVYKTADFHKPWNIGVTPDPTIQARIDALNNELRPILGTQIGTSSVAIPRSDKCGRADGRLCESRVGNTVTDALRTSYLTDFAITNSGGLRADLTCPTTDLADDFCPAYTPPAPPPFNITRGQVLAVLPFGNVAVTLSVNGAELKTMLENGVSQMPGANGRFPQVSGLCFTYDIQQAAGSRVTGAVRQAADGSCTGAPVDLTAASTYSIAENDFMADGGDGYPVFRPRMTTRDIMDQALANYVAAASPLNAPLQNRIVCADSNTAAPPACPAITAG